MKALPGRRRPMWGRIGAALLALALAATLAPEAARCEPGPRARAAGDGDEGISAARAAALSRFIDGEWVGARLLCRKEEDDAVRCGKPVSFSVTFRRDGTGSSTDEHFPHSFRYRWKSLSEMALEPLPRGEELTLFQLEIKEGFLTFQTYIFLATDDPARAREDSYIHYIFDVHRIE